MRCTPSASTTDRIAGSPSGTAATASETPSSSTVTTSAAVRDAEEQEDRGHHDHGDDDHRDAEHAPDPGDLPLQRGRAPPAWRRACSAIAPIWVAMPVAVTTARPAPCVTAVPLKTMFDAGRRARASSGSVRASLSTASLSPVSDASDTFSVAADSSRAVRRHGVALGEQHDVARHQLPGWAPAAARRPAPRWRSSRSSAAAPRPRSPPAPAARTRAAAFSTTIDRDDDRVERHAGAALDQPRQQRDHDRREQQVDERVPELREELPPPGHRLGGGDLVRPVSASRRAASSAVSPRSGSVRIRATTTDASSTDGSRSIATSVMGLLPAADEIASRLYPLAAVPFRHPNADLIRSPAAGPKARFRDADPHREPAQRSLSEPTPPPFTPGRTRPPARIARRRARSGTDG